MEPFYCHFSSRETPIEIKDRIHCISYFCSEQERWGRRCIFVLEAGYRLSILTGKQFWQPWRPAPISEKFPFWTWELQVGEILSEQCLYWSISLLPGNRRTASVCSVGYSDLFVLSKTDMWDVLKDYPAARVRLEAVAAKKIERYKKVPLEKGWWWWPHSSAAQ